MPATTVAIKTVGCRLNQAETTEFEAAFRAAGFNVVMPAAASCDVYVIHGCAVTAAAERESLRHARSFRRRRPDALIIVAGCAAEQALRNGLADTGSSTVDQWIGQTDKHRLPALVSQALHQPLTGTPAASRDLAVDGWRQGSRTRALVKVQDGCAFRCAYCIVPLLRSRQISRPMADILERVRRLSAQGCREIVLTGANLGCYHDHGRRLPDLLRALIDIPNGPRIRLSSIESSTVETEVIDIMASSDRICRYLHLPLQSGDDAVLRRMARRYTVTGYRERIAQATRAMNRVGLGTDILVGFPGETDAEFENTVRVVDELPFTNLHVFPFSPRPGTPAAAMTDSVSQALKSERVRRLNALGAEKQVRFAGQHVGRRVTVLLEKIERDTGTGWTGEYLPARVRGNGLRANQIVHPIVSDHERATLLADGT